MRRSIAVTAPASPGYRFVRRPANVSSRYLAFRGPGLLQRDVLGHGGEGVQLRRVALDAIQITLRQLDRRELPRVDALAQLGDREIEDIVRDHDSPRLRSPTRGWNANAIGLPGGSSYARITLSWSASDFS